MRSPAARKAQAQRNENALGQAEKERREVGVSSWPTNAHRIEMRGDSMRKNRAKEDS